MSEQRSLGQFLDDLVRIGVTELVGHGLAEEMARKAMRGVVDSVCIEYARADFYVPARFDARNAAIVAAFYQHSKFARACSEDRVAEIASEYALTTRQIYNIVRQAREAEFASRQATLPGLEPEPTSRA